MKILSRKIIFFCLIGVVNTVIDFGFFNLLIHVFGLSHTWSYPFFKGISFCVACINSYILNARYSFNNAQMTTRSFGLFFFVTVCGMTINIVAATMIFGMIQNFALPQLLKINGPVLAATALSMVWNFIFYNYVIFHKEK